MSLIDTLTPRRGRPPKVDTSVSPIAAALARPLPDGVPEALAEIDRAKAAFDRARAARDTAAEDNVEARLAVAKAKLTKLEVATDIAGQMGEDAPPEDELTAARTQVADLERVAANQDLRLQEFNAEIERRRQALDAAHSSLTALLEGWKHKVRNAIDDAFDAACRLLGEAEGALRAVDGWRAPSLPFRTARITSEGQHVATPVVELPPAVADVFAKWDRTQRELTRT